MVEVNHSALVSLETHTAGLLTWRAIRLQQSIKPTLLSQHYQSTHVQYGVRSTFFFQKYCDFEYYHQRVKADGAACPVPKFLLG